MRKEQGRGRGLLVCHPVVCLRRPLPSDGEDTLLGGSAEGLEEALAHVEVTGASAAWALVNDGGMVCGTSVVVGDLDVLATVAAVVVGRGGQSDDPVRAGALPATGAETSGEVGGSARAALLDGGGRGGVGNQSGSSDSDELEREHSEKR